MRHEAAGTAEWTGTPLRHVLERAGIGDGAVENAILGTDRGVAVCVEHNFAWSKWQFSTQATPGEHGLKCRAADANGDVRPPTPRWDNSGYGNNAIQVVAVTVR